MTKYARWESLGVPEIFDGKSDVIIDDVHHPRNIVNVWPEEAVLNLGLMLFIDGIIPSGHRVLSKSYEEITGEIHEILVTELIPIQTLDDVYEETLLNGRVLKALVLCLNDGTIVPGGNVSAAVLKEAIKAKM